MGTSSSSYLADTESYHCEGVRLMPYDGTEILVLGCIFLSFCALFCITFLDVGLKQMWPHKWLDPKVRKLVKKLQDDFPGHEKNEYIPELSDGKTGKLKEKYDKIVAQTAYVASSSPDEDLLYPLANKDAYGTISEYCSCTTRGYAMLSDFLLLCSFFFGFMWAHNATITEVTFVRKVNLFGYCMVMLTGCMMTTPGVNAVFRNRTILMWGSISTSNPLVKLHNIGISGFLFVPMGCHIYQLWYEEHLPNRYIMQLGVNAQLFGLACFFLPTILSKKPFQWIDPVKAKKLTFLGEILVVMLTDITYVQIEFFPTAVCGDSFTFFMIMGAVSIMLPLLIFAGKVACGNPDGEFANGPSVLLCKLDKNEHLTPVAASGHLPVLNFDENPDGNTLPYVRPAEPSTESSGRKSASTYAAPKRASSSRKKK